MERRKDASNEIKETQEIPTPNGSKRIAAHHDHGIVESHCSLNDYISSELSSVNSCDEFKRGHGNEYNAMIDEEYFTLNKVRDIDNNRLIREGNTIACDRYTSSTGYTTENSNQNLSGGKTCVETNNSNDFLETSQNLNDVSSYESHHGDKKFPSNEERIDLKHDILPPNNNYDRPGLSFQDSVSTIQTLYTNSSKTKPLPNENKCSELEDGSLNLSLSLSLRPSMISSSIIKNNDNDESNFIVDHVECPLTSLTLDELGDTICSSVNPSPSQKQALPNSENESINCPTHSTSGHEYNSFLNVGHHLLSSSNITNPSFPETNLDIKNENSNDEAGIPSYPNEKNHWWEKFSEEDWETMKEAAKFVFVESQQIRTESKFNTSRFPENKCLPVIPPSPPSDFLSLMTSSMESLSVLEQSSYSSASKNQRILSSLFPAEFLCPLCHDLIVGAAILDCSCPMNTFCGSCLEKKFTIDEKNQIRSNNNIEVGFLGEERISIASPDMPARVKNGIDASQEMIQERDHHCPSCKTQINRTVPCHTLDIAILSAVINTRNSLGNYCQTNGLLVDISHEDVIQFQHDYYCRLQSWRETVLKRHEVAFKEQDRRTEILLSLLIQKEEEMFWKMKHDSKNDSEDEKSNLTHRQTVQERTSDILNIGRTRMLDVAVFVTAAAIGLSFLRRH